MNALSHISVKRLYFFKKKPARLWLKTDQISIDIPDLIKLKYLKRNLKKSETFLK